MSSWQQKLIKLAQQNKTYEAIQLLDENLKLGNAVDPKNLVKVLEAAITLKECDNVIRILNEMINCNQECPAFNFRDGIAMLLRSAMLKKSIEISYRYLMGNQNQVDESCVAILLEHATEREDQVAILEMVQKVIDTREPNFWFWKMTLKGFNQLKAIDLVAKLMVQVPAKGIDISWDEFIYQAAATNQHDLVINTLLEAEKQSNMKLAKPWESFVKIVGSGTGSSVDKITQLLEYILPKDYHISGVGTLFKRMVENDKEEIILKLLEQYQTQWLSSQTLQYLLESLFQANKMKQAYQLMLMITKKDLGESIWEEIRPSSEGMQNFIHFVLTQAEINFKDQQSKQEKPKISEKANTEVQTEQQEQKFLEAPKIQPKKQENIVKQPEEDFEVI